MMTHTDVTLPKSELTYRIRPLNKFMGSLLPPFFQQFLSRSFLVFVFIGTTTAFFDYLLYLGLLSFDWPMLAAKATSSAIAVIGNYMLNATFNFERNHVMSPKHLSAYAMLYAVLIVIHALCNQGLFLKLNNVHLAVFGALCISTFVNYIGVRKFFTYYRHQ